MKHIDFRPHLSHQEAITLIKAATLLLILFYGEPDLMGSLVALVGRVG